jgi:hypothetical protein
MANKDCSRLERICVGGQEKWRISRSNFSWSTYEGINTLTYTDKHLFALYNIFICKTMIAENGFVKRKALL